MRGGRLSRQREGWLEFARFASGLKATWIKVANVCRVRGSRFFLSKDQRIVQKIKESERKISGKKK